MPDYLDTDEAAEFLGVQRSTVYAYVSRGLLESVAADEEDGRRTLYRKRDLERLRKRSAAETGEGPAAGTALDWGASSLETAVGTIGPRGPSYRGRPLRELLGEETYEETAERLWRGETHGGADWPDFDPVAEAEGGADGSHPLEHLSTVVQRLRTDDLRKFSGGREREVERGRTIVRRLAAAGRDVFDVGDTVDPAPDASTAEVVAHALGVRADDAIELVERTLVCSADHGLNTSTFAARVAASTGTDLYAAILAALATFAGPRHGLSSERVRSFLRRAMSADDPGRLLVDSLQRGEAVPGFGHPLYEHGDPRYEMLRRAVRQLAPADYPGETVDALEEAAREADLEPPNLDVGFALVAESIDAPVGGAPFLFAVGRSAGWIAHALEQRQRGELLRPTAIEGE